MSMSSLEKMVSTLAVRPLISAALRVAVSVASAVSAIRRVGDDGEALNWGATKADTDEAKSSTSEAEIFMVVCAFVSLRWVIYDGMPVLQ